MKRTTFHLLAGISILCVVASACKSAPAPRPQTLPPEPGAGACKATTKRGELTLVTRWVREGKEVRKLIDQTGDGQPNRIEVTTLDADNRPVTIVATTPDGKVLSRQNRTYEGQRLVRIEDDMLAADGSPGSDGAADAVTTLEWESGVLVRETFDQLDADGLLGTDGKPEYATEWEAKNGQRVRGVKTDVRDGATLETVGMVWVGGQLALETVDLGGDGSIDVTIKRSWADDMLLQSVVEGSIDNSATTYEYCR